MDIVVKGRKTEVPERFRRHVAEKLKLDKIQRIDGKVTRLDVEVSKEPNPRQADRSDRVEITLRHRGPVVRAEAAAADPYGALDLAVEKLESRLRRQHDKRSCRRGRRRIPASEVSAVVPGVAVLDRDGQLAPPAAEEEAAPAPVVRTQGGIEVQGDGPLVVREKTHRAAPMSLDQALYEMELVGHDFYLFVDAETKQPSVVYRRRAYDYGVIHLETDPLAAVPPDGAGSATGG
ncbi:ribosome hibernation-promoting factor, HPF/YfiA family [Streptomyces sp. 7-21]|uniref:ribosome hibernation-promoting factor, HPF/YfiA family n=1 Tax=Streptomyces sp. 7-21 TaxID=2802283 RepID=UPI00191DC54F|nr:ribosome-associated translation inhibitor RaiA [Streptomyces sp. 7-21]MBL1068521.1 ribosome-associated translation inhibitor RaiA [Streptomyces sp. 7-21]